MNIADPATLASVNAAVEMYARNSGDEAHLRSLMTTVYAQGVVDGTKNVAAAMRQQQAEMLQT